MTARQIVVPAVGASLWIVLAVVGWRAYQRIGAQNAAAEICQAVAEKRWSDALTAEVPAPRDEPTRRAAECRALALLATEERPAAAALLESALADDWLPQPVLTLLLVAEWREAGRLEEAGALVE
ncbi:MAG: hypothetical protein AAF725_27340, partial [Acidobacteriota bacterium]